MRLQDEPYLRPLCFPLRRQTASDLWLSLSPWVRMWWLLPRPLAALRSARASGLSTLSSCTSGTTRRAAAKKPSGSTARHGASGAARVATCTPRASFAPVHPTADAAVPTYHAATAKHATQTATPPRRLHELPRHVCGGGRKERHGAERLNAANGALHARSATYYCRGRRCLNHV